MIDITAELDDRIRQYVIENHDLPKGLGKMIYDEDFIEIKGVPKGLYLSATLIRDINIKLIKS